MIDLASEKPTIKDYVFYKTAELQIVDGQVLYFVGYKQNWHQVNKLDSVYEMFQEINTIKV